MHILIIGAAGMVGRKLTMALLSAGAVGADPIDKITLADVVAPDTPVSAIPCNSHATDLSVPGAAAKLVADRPDVVFHLAAIVSGEAEADFEKGYAINLDGTRFLLEAIRQQGMNEPYCPRLVFTSSIAVFGEPLPPAIPDDMAHTPLTSYGTQKAICELLLADYSRRGFVDGIGIRLPTIAVRPGKPNKAASGFFSGIIREPLNGMEAVLPVDESVRHWFASPRAAIGFLLQAAALDTAPLGQRRTLTMPGLSATIAEEIAALERFGGVAATRLIRREPDETIARIVAGWPQNFDARRALDLGFVAEASFDDIVRAHIEDELGGRVAPT
ncbi:nucleoside-diphosphate-sugar epimerase [Devosia subaequoris]|uniref:Nucleoside-diphosphate-sugar epimerase n=1 Tax=Devosia subaequoris TaxID=395930 RepID=A0A7W6NCB6_9HYPH|nr:D-erythronate dehydrogenase [Devosia subaequoris]MBB4052753.1 nucleoside-diphosphate-sugar epimerase [Devosia subaequoris]MCP1209906.1 SDR family oxidoreductase [Devosia subaequoris]